MDAASLILIVFIICTAVQLAIYGLVFARLIAYRDPLPAASRANASDDAQLPPVSVIVCARNEGPNLRINLPLLLGQDYPDWELLVVDDGSSDGSSEWLAGQAQIQPRLKVLRVEENQKAGPGKKGALALGIAASRHSILLLTDADCRPATPQWIRHMASQYDERTDIVLGYGAYELRPGFLNRVIQFETLHTLVQYAGWTLAGMPYMGIGRNLSYRKSVYQRVGGFTTHQHWPSGDDDLLVNAAAVPGRVALCLNPAAWTLSAPVEEWKDWVRQKSRHLSTGVFYRPLHRLALGAYSLSHFGCYASFLVCIALCSSIPLVLGLFTLRLLLQAIMFQRLGKRFERPELWHFSTIFDFLTVLYYARFVHSTLVPKPPIWR